MHRQKATVAQLAEEIVACRACPRLIQYIENVAREKRRAYQDWEYWGKPVPGFGDPLARLLVVGLAPAAHGANRTGRMFTGDDSGAWLARALYGAGFANQPESYSRDDGFSLQDAYITAVCRCAPPNNKPTAGEMAACRPFLVRELTGMATVEVILCLGRIAFDSVLRIMADEGWGWPVPVDELDGAADEPGGRAGRPKKPAFRHGGEYRWPAAAAKGQRLTLLASYHPSRQNTNTGVLTEEMFESVFQRARALLPFFCA
ncbi:MAG TPA: uracil-DNA glycosylase [Sphingobacteriaceae bacterium]|nr:uracil-DNA glycosylase [Sphingobacteriaceae bacterium]